MKSLGHFTPIGDKIHVTWFDVPKPVLVYLGSYAKRKGWLDTGKYFVSNGHLYISPDIKDEFVTKARVFHNEVTGYTTKVETSKDLKSEQMKLWEGGDECVHTN